MAVSEDFQALADAIDRLAVAFGALGSQYDEEELEIKRINKLLTLERLKQEAASMNISITVE